ncbi:MAG: tetratricopeptide repeat protein [Burkholderiaceae bacterium]|nr:tetratricopeptide repeat protein [Burkholderiaceae bacterium]
MQGFIRNFGEIAQQWLAMAWAALRNKIRPGGRPLASDGDSQAAAAASAAATRMPAPRRWRRLALYAALISAVGAIAVRWAMPAASNAEHPAATAASAAAANPWLNQYQTLRDKAERGQASEQEIETLVAQPEQPLRNWLKQHLRALLAYERQYAFPAGPDSHLVSGEVLSAAAPDEKAAYGQALLTQWRGHLFSGDIQSARALAEHFETRRDALALEKPVRLAAMALQLQLATLDPRDKSGARDLRRKLVAEIDILPDPFESAATIEAQVAVIEASTFAGDIADAQKKLARLTQWLASASQENALDDSLRARLAAAAMALGQYADARTILRPFQAQAAGQAPACARTLEHWLAQAELTIHEGQVIQAEHALANLQACFSARNGGGEQPHLQLARTHNLAGQLHLLLAQPEQALQSFGAARDLWSALLGERHFWVGHAHNNLGAAQRLKGELPAARQQFEAAGGLWSEVLGAAHPLMATYHNNMAELEMLEGAPAADVKAKLDSALDARRVYGDKHPWTAVVLGNLGELANLQEQFDQALRYHTAALEIRQATYGQWHPDSALSLNNLGTVQFRMGEFNLALQSFERSLAVLEKMLGDANARTAAVIDNLAATQMALQDFASADKLLARLVQIETARGPGRQAALAAALVRLGDARQRLGALPEAERAYLDALQNLGALSDAARPRDTARNALEGLKTLLPALGKPLPSQELQALAPWLQEEQPPQP